MGIGIGTIIAGLASAAGASAAAAPVWGTIGTAALAGGASLYASNKLSAGQPGIQPLPNAPSSQSKEVQDAELAERDRLKRAKGRSSTILTGSSNLGTAPTQTKTLLGGN